MPIVMGRICRQSPRSEAWLRVFGGDQVPLLSPLPVYALSPAGEREFYRVAVDALSDDQRRRVVAHVAEHFGRPLDEVRRDLADPDHGLPILADDVVVSVDARAFL